MDGSLARRQRGFSMMELAVVAVILALLAAAIAPRMFGASTFSSREFYDEVIAALRYAQNAAVAQNRFVCVAFASGSVTLTTGTNSSCAANPGGSVNLTGPSGQAPYAVTSSNGVSLSGYANFSFAATGQPYNLGDTPPVSSFTTQTISVSGYSSAITIEAGTGYVH